AEIETRPSARENVETGKSSSHLYRGPGSTRLTLRHDKGSGRSREEGASGGRASAPPDSAVASDTITTKTRLAFRPVHGPWGMRPWARPAPWSVATRPTPAGCDCDPTRKRRLSAF